MSGFDFFASFGIRRDDLSPRLVQIAILMQQVNNRFTSAARDIGNGFTSAAPKIEKTVGLFERFLKVSTGLFVLNRVKNAVTGLVGDFAEFEKQLQLAAIQADATTKQVNEMRESILRISQDTGRPLDELTVSLKETASQGFNVADAIKVVDQAAKLASANGEDVVDVAKNLRQILKGFNIDLANIGTVADRLQQANKTGGATLGEFARQLGNVVPLAREVGISFDDLIVAINAITQTGIPTTKAITDLREAFQKLLSPSQRSLEQVALLNEANKGIPELQINFSAAAVSGGKFLEMLLRIVAAAKGDQTVLKNVLGDEVRSFTGLLALAQDSGKNFKEGADLLRKAFGSVDRDATRIFTNISGAIERFDAVWEAFKIRVLLKIEPIVTGIANLVGALFRAIGDEIGRAGPIINSFGDKLNGLAEGITKLSRLGVFKFHTLVLDVLGDVAGILITGVELLAKRVAIAFFDVLRDTVVSLIGGSNFLRKIIGEDFFKLTDASKEVAQSRAEIALDQREIKSLREARQNAQGEQADLIDKMIADAERRIAAAGKRIDNASFTLSQRDSQQLLAPAQAAFDDAVEALTTRVEGIGASAKLILGATSAGKSIGKFFGLSFSEEAAKTIKEKQDTAGPLGQKPARTGPDLPKALGELELFSSRGQKAVDLLNEKRRVAQDELSRGLISNVEAHRRERAALDDFNESFARSNALIKELRDSGATLTPEIENAIKQIEHLQLSAKDTKDTFDDFGLGLQQGILRTTNALSDMNVLAQELGATLTNTFADFIVLVAKGQKSFSEFAGKFLEQIGEMIFKAALFRLISGFIGGVGGGATASTGNSTGGFLGIAFKAEGGPVPGPDVRRDVVPAMLTPREYVVRRDSADYYGPQILNAINQRLIPRSMFRGFGSSGINPTGNFATGGPASFPDSRSRASRNASVLALDDQLLARLLAAAPGVMDRFIKDRRGSDPRRGRS